MGVDHMHFSRRAKALRSANWLLDFFSKKNIGRWPIKKKADSDGTSHELGDYMYRLAERLWPIPRSISGPGTRKTLEILQGEVANLSIGLFESGKKVFDWTVPEEWRVNEAHIIDPEGNMICDYSENNLHLVGYSEPISGKYSRDQLEPYLHSIEDQPDAIPYLTSYYKKSWGFCMSHNDKKSLPEGEYTVKIDSEFSTGGINYGEVLVSGSSRREVFFSTYICHPSMANNELSGPVLAVALARYVQSMDPFYSYRFVFLPETIGAIAYVEQHLSELKERMLAGYVLTCVGDERSFSYMPSRKGDTVSDRFAKKTLENLKISYKSYSWGDRGSDERQYCAPGIDLPVCSIMRSKYGEYPEYHTSLDRLGSVVTPQGLQQSYDLYKALIDELEANRFPRVTTLCEPKLDRRGLYPPTLEKGDYARFKPTQDVISECDGKQTPEEIAKRTGLSKQDVVEILKILEKKDLIKT
jgi:aminopeptidase-like protein